MLLVRTCLVSVALALMLVGCFRDRGAPGDPHTDESSSSTADSTSTTSTGAESPTSTATSTSTGDPPTTTIDPTTTHPCLESVYYLDGDGDGYGQDDMTVTACDPPPGYTDQAGDCDPKSSDVSPAQLEVCDGIDNDCDLSVDEYSPINLACNGCRTFGADKRLYYLCSVLRDWTAARLACNAYGPGTDLVILHSEAEQSLIVGEIQSVADEAAGQWWLGLGDSNLEGTFVWIDDSPADFTSWLPMEPNDSMAVEDCAQYPAGLAGMWNDITCTTPSFYICEGPV